METLDEAIILSYFAIRGPEKWVGIFKKSGNNTFILSFPIFIMIISFSCLIEFDKTFENNVENDM